VYNCSRGGEVEGEHMVGRLVGAGVAALIGVVWILQGLDIRKGDGMSGHPIWAVLGAVLVLFALALVRGARRSEE
jgi:uncharacterized membrane protein YeaQ/YmgE (transglycosylase-associated protein family)